jgi:hypothetical protein
MNDNLLTFAIIGVAGFAVYSIAKNSPKASAAIAATSPPAPVAASPSQTIPGTLATDATNAFSSWLNDSFSNSGSTNASTGLSATALPSDSGANWLNTSFGL